MADYLEPFVWIATIGAGIFGALKLYQLWAPIRVEGGYTLEFQDCSTDTINVRIVNRSSEPQYVVACAARGITPLWVVAKRIITMPLTSRLSWQQLRFDTFSYEFLNHEKIKIDPLEQIDLKRRAFSGPMCFWFASQFVVIVTLSTRRKFRCRQMEVPNRWRERTFAQMKSRQAAAQQGAAGDV